MRFEYPRHLRFRCLRCALCCGDTEVRERRILLLEAEARRISEATSMEIGEFAERVEGSEPFLYRMRKREGRCLFLRGNLCSIYEIRPIICRFYPFQLENLGGDRYRFSYTEECPGIGEGPELGREFFEELFEEFLKVMATI